MAGLSEEGFLKKTLAEIKTDLETSLRSTFGIFINLLPGSVFATILGIFAERLAELWDVAEDVYNSRYPDTAEGVSLDNAIQFNAIERLGAVESTQPDQLLFGDEGTLVPAGTQFSVDGNESAKFQTDSDVTLVAGVNAIQTLDYSSEPDAGTFTLTYRGQTTAAIDYNADATAIQNALNALSNLSGVVVTGDVASGFEIEFDGDDGLQEQPLLTASSGLTDNASPVDITIAEDTAGEPQGVVDCTATETGEVDAPIGTLTVIDTPVAGLNRTINVSATVLGRDRETDAELRLRRAATLSVAGNATVEAIRSRILNLEGVRNCFIFENTDIATDGDGRPGKSYEVVVDGGDDQEIADLIWLSKPAGIETYGEQTENVTDSQGNIRQVSFSRPTPIQIYASIDLTVDPDVFPETGAASAKQALLDWGNALNIGTDVIVYPQLVAQFTSIPGILDVAVRIDTSPVSTNAGDPAVDDNIEIAPFEVASFATADVGVNTIEV